MKKIITLLVLLTTSIFFAQTTGITYQAVLCNPTGEILPGNNNPNAVLANQNICMRFSIKDAATNLEYQETQKVKTDEYGMVNLIVGEGSQIGGYAINFSAIVWNSTIKKLQVAIDITGTCSNFIEISDQNFSAVPFAYASKTTENVSGIVAITNGGTGANTVSGAKTNLGLNNVDNTSDANKPISTATQTALDTKAPLASPALTGTPTVPTASVGNSTNQIANTTFVTSAITAAATPDATATVKGKLKLTGDLAGTADAPRVPGLVNKENTIAAGTTSQYFRGDKTWQTIDKTVVGLSNADNTSDANKPVSTATQTALNTKENTIAAGTTSQYFRGDKTWQTIDKMVVGLSNADNTSDANKPVSTATQTALNTKENTIAAGTISQYFRGDKTWQTIDKTVVGLSNADNTSDANKPISTATQTALNAKEDSANKSTLTTLGDSDLLFPTQKAVKTYVDNQISSGVVDATSTIKGKIKLAGDITGSADLPIIANNAINSSKIAAGAVTDAKITSVNSSKVIGSIPVTQVNGAVGKVNGILPNGDGTVVIPFGIVRTGTLVARPIVSSTTNGDIYVVSGDSNTNNNGLTYISDGASWNEVTPNQASLDARYLKLGGGTMSGNIVVPSGKFISIADAPTNPIDAANKAYVDSRVTGGATPDATTTSLGKIQLAGDLRGTAEAPTVPGLASKAPLDSPSLTGIPSAPTAGSGTSTTQIATTEFVTNALSASNSNARSGDLDMNGNAILNISNARMAQLAILDEEAHPFFNGNDTNAITILNRENNVTQFLDGRTGSPILAITNSVNETDVYGSPTVEEGKIGIGTRTPSEKLEVLGNIKADKFIKTGGTPSQFLKADGSVDSNTYLTTSSAAGAYETTIAAGTTSQYYRGDKSWQTLDKTVVGLGNVDNTSDANKPVSIATQTALDTKVDKVTGKGLSSEDYSTTEKNKLAGIAAGAEVNVNADWNATTGDAQILNKPTIPSIAGLATETFVNNGLALKENTIAAGTTSQYYRGDKSWQTLDKSAVGLANVDNTADANKPVSMATQTALNLKANLASPTFTGDTKAETATAGDSDTSIATTAFVGTAITNAATPNATTINLGKIQLGGDLAGTGSSAASPVISNNAITTSKILDDAVTNAKIGEIISVENGGTGSNMTTTAGYVKQATTGSNLSTVSTIPVADVTGAVRSVNGVVPASNGNVAVIIGRVFTGATVDPNLATSIISASPPKQSSDIYIVADGSNPNNGRTFIYDGTNWLEVATDLSTTDARYVNVAGDTMEGNLTIPTGTKIIITDAPTGSTDAVNKAYIDGLITSSATPDATATVKGKIKLAGDLGGTADAPTVVTNAITSAKILDGTITTDDLAAASVTNAKIGETITVANGGTGVATLTGYVKGTGTTAMTASSTIPVADVIGAQTIANLSTDITADTGSDTKYPSVKAVETAVTSKVGGSGTTNYVPKFSATKTLTNSTIFDDGTKVGIGTTTPTTVLSVQGSANVDNANANTGTLNSNSLLFGNGTGEGIGSTRVGTTNLHGINFFTFSILRMALTNSGYLGIGTSSPFTPLSNTSSNIFGSDGQGVNGFSWSTGVSGYTAAIYNSGNTASYNGLAVKVANNAATTYALDISRGTSQATAGTPLFDVLGNGNVGIGTASPASKLDVSAGITSVNSTINATGSINDFLQYNIQNTSTGTQAQSGYSATADNGSATTGFAWLGINNSGFNYPTAYNIGRANDVSFVGSGQDMYLANANNTKSIIFSTGRATTPFFNEQMRILNNGNVGIGTATPANKLEITQGTAGNSGLRFTNLTSSSTATTASSKVLGVNANGDVILTNIPGTQNIVDFSTATPTTSGVVFTPNTPADQSVVYQSAIDNSLWTYNGSTYVTYTAPSSTAWFTSGTTNDAGNSKISNIYRTGRVGIGTNNPVNNLDVVGGFNLRNTSGAAGSNFGMEFNTNSSSPRIDWVYNGAYTGSFAGDADFFFRLQNSRVGAGGFRFMTNPSGTAVERMTILNNGNVGIGNINPTATLDVQSPLVGTFVTTARFLTPSNTTAGNSNVLNFGVTATTGNSADWRYVYQSNGAATNRVDFGMSGYAAPMMSYLNSGNVGIGTTTPSSKLHIQGIQATLGANANATMLRMSRPTWSGYKWGSAAQFNLGTYDDGVSPGNSKSRLDLALTNTDETTLTTTMTWLANGNVGINNTAPSAPLVVQGVTGTGSLKLIAPSVASGDNWWLGFGHGTTSTDANDRARIGTDIVSGGAGRLFFTTGAPGSQTRAMFIDESQRVGIGTSTPTSRLDVISNSTEVARFTSSQFTSNYAGIGIGNASGAWSKIASGEGKFQIRNFSTDATIINAELGTGNVGIGTTSPTSRLEVNGSATNTAAFNSGSATAILFNNSNLAYTSASPTSFSLQGIKDGGTYTLAVQGTTSGTSSFSAVGFTFKSINNGTTIAGKDTLYTFVVMGTTVYVYMATGF